ncbi:hypothetical protein KAW18_14130 [candidate division WOR-3 bacterium]|nr:hypothetical protein [candidate division WOR-3 bacterium]
MVSEIVISVSHYIKWSEIPDILEKGRFEYIPATAYVVQNEGPERAVHPELLYFPKAFSLWELNLSIELLCKYAGDEIRRKEELKVAKKAYLKLRNFAKRCAERVLADLSCALLLKTWNSVDQFIYFMEGPPSDKILARLSYLYPSLKNLTICFISFEPKDLITSVMSFQTGRLQFDIHRLISEEITGFQGPYPGTSEESLVQTYFYRHPEVRPGKKVSPIRVDIFCQGLLESDIEDKKEIIRKKIEDETWTSPYIIEHPVEVLLPKGLINVIDSWKEFDKTLESVLKTQIRKGSEQ